MRHGNGWKRYERRKSHKGRNYHHLRPVSRGGRNTSENLLLIHQERHFYWHKVFGNMTLMEAIQLLERCQRMKGYREEAA